MSEQKYVTRREGVKVVREHGIPLSMGRVNKDSMEGRGPKPFGKYGPSDIYTAEEFMRYAVDRVRSPDGEAAPAA
jgi:hypothetical protein